MLRQAAMLISSRPITTHNVIKMTRIIDYQDGQPVDKKLRDQPNKIIALFHGSYRTVGKIC
jgi:hypothetical protein